MNWAYGVLAQASRATSRQLDLPTGLVGSDSVKRLEGHVGD